MTSSFLVEAGKALDHFHQELQVIRTGRANPAIVENLMVDAYGAATPLQQVAAINTPEPRLLVIQPWDQSLTKDIERAITTSSLGITPVVDGKVIRLPFPAMTEERRKVLLKTVNEKGEAARVRIRTLREDMIKKLRAQEKDGSLSEDALALEVKKLQQAVDQQLGQIEATLTKKHEELTEI